MILVNKERLQVEDMDEFRYMSYFHVYDYKCQQYDVDSFILLDFGS